MMEPPSDVNVFPCPRQRSTSRDRSENANQTQSIHDHLSQLVWEAGSKQVKDTFNSYGRIDFFRPYFDVDPKQVRNRLFQSLIPRKPSKILISKDMYGPLMLIFTLVALLLFTMKTSGYTVQDGTLIGTAIVTSFSYWLFASLAIYAICYVFMSDVQMAQVFSLLGYALFGHCIVILLTGIFHPSHSHLFFYALMIIFAGPSCVRMAIYLSSKTRDKSHKMALVIVIFAIHLSFLTYLHFGFHKIVEEIDEMFVETTNQHNMMIPKID